MIAKNETATVTRYVDSRTGDLLKSVHLRQDNLKWQFTDFSDLGLTDHFDSRVEAEAVAEGITLVDGEARTDDGGILPCKIDSATIGQAQVRVIVSGDDSWDEFAFDRVRVGNAPMEGRFRAVPADTEWSIWDSREQGWADKAAGLSAIVFPTQAIAQDVARLMNAVG